MSVMGIPRLKEFWAEGMSNTRERIWWCLPVPGRRSAHWNTLTKREGDGYELRSYVVLLFNIMLSSFDFTLIALRNY